MAILQTILSNWIPLTVALLAVDSAIIPIFPDAGLLKTIATWLTNAGKL